MSLLSRNRASFRVAPVESLESRTMLHNVLLAPVADMTLPAGGPTTIDLTQHIDYEEVSGTVVNMATNFGPIQIELYDTATPGTVANFLKYVEANRYDNAI